MHSISKTSKDRNEKLVIAAAVIGGLRSELTGIISPEIVAQFCDLQRALTLLKSEIPKTGSGRKAEALPAFA